MIAEIVRDNFRDLLVLVGLGVAYYGATDAEPPSGVSAPEWWPLLLVGGLLGLFGILLASGKIEDLWPEEHGVYLTVVKAKDNTVLEVWELSEDKFADLEVVDGPLNELPNAKHRAYEVYAYNPDSNVAVATWRQSLPASQLVGHKDVEDALTQIRELRDHLEPMAKRGRYIRQNLPSILRELDRQRALNQAQAVEPSIAPSFGGETVNDALDRQLPEELKPTRLSGNAEEAEQMADEMGSEMNFEILDDLEDEPLEPMENGHEQ